MADVLVDRNPFLHLTNVSATVEDREILMALQSKRTAHDLVQAVCTQIVTRIAQEVLKEIQPRVMEAVRCVITELNKNVAETEER